MRWYLLQTKPNAHFKACDNLKKQGFDVFLPLSIITIKMNGKFKNKTIPLFPGYLFTGTRIEPVPWKSINGTRGISKAVTLDGKYRSIDSRIVEGLQRRCDKNSVIQSLDDIVSGDRIKIERGAFSDFICTVDKIKDNERAWVLIDLLQKQTRAEISLSNVSKIH